MAVKPWLILFVGGMKESPPEEMVGAVQRAAALDTLDRALATRAFDGIVVATDHAELAAQVPPGVIVEMDEEPFHFGQRLRDLINRYSIERPFYVGGGSCPLMSADELGAIAAELQGADNTVIANNLFSADMVAFTPGSAINDIDPPATDNPLPRNLRQERGLHGVALPRTAATQFDIDTPTDLLILKVHPAAGPRTQALLDTLDLDVSRMWEAIELFTDPDAEVLVTGRVGSYVWAHLERDTACRVRVLSEERGMRADGREERGHVYSILGYYLQEVGIPRFFETLAHLGNAAFMDSRVVFHHLKLQPIAADRFYSDLGRVDAIGDPVIREFTERAFSAEIPVILGGHSLVAGGMYALIDAAWLDYDRRYPSARERSMPWSTSTLERGS